MVATNWKFTTLRHWGEGADQGAFALRVADGEPGAVTTTTSDRRRLDADDGVLVKWTLQLYGHDSDTSTPWTPQPTPRDGCDAVAVSGSDYQASRHGTTYLAAGARITRIRSTTNAPTAAARITSGITIMATGSWAQTQTAAPRPPRAYDRLRRRPRGRVRRLGRVWKRRLGSQLQHPGHLPDVAQPTARRRRRRQLPTALPSRTDHSYRTATRTAIPRTMDHGTLFEGATRRLRRGPGRGP